jgi:hypothetical protein
MAAKIATLEVEMPEFILKRTGKKRLFTDSSERTHSYAGRVRRVMNTRLRRLN